MGRLVARYAALVVAVIVLNFGMPRLLPGDPLEREAGDGLNAVGSTLTAEARAELRATYHLDRSLGGQFLAYLDDLAHGDLGWSISESAPVAGLIRDRLPWTLGLMLVSLVIAGVGGVLLGVVGAWRGGRVDRGVVMISAAVAAVPEFLLAMGLLLGLAVGLGWFPLHGGRAAFADRPGGVFGSAEGFADVAWHLALPALTLVLSSAAGFVLLARGAVGATLAAPYVTTARAKGLSEPRVALRHAMPNALPPILTLFGLRFGQILGGAIVVERVFGVPGLGLFAFEATRARDYPVLQAVFLLGSLSVLAVNFGVDVASRRWDTRRG